MRFNTGDLVKVKDELKTGGKYGNAYFTEDMTRFKGTVQTVDTVFNDGYLLKDMRDNFLWTDEMLEEQNKHFDGELLSGYENQITQPERDFIKTLIIKLDLTIDAERQKINDSGLYAIADF